MFMKIINDWGALIGILAVLGIEISPIKINPIGWLLKYIGKLLNQDIKKEVSSLSEKVDKLEELSKTKFEAEELKQRITNYHTLLLTNGLDNNQYRRCFELEDKYRLYQEKYEKKYPGRVNGHLDAMLEAIHSNYLNGNIIFMEDEKDGNPKK